ncbi:MAG: sulfatase-like hydrolase/transferase [Clostridia bacterium]|nr:sulfatase-like hydrolase/transferase [Clostridia bacterium]
MNKLSKYKPILKDRWKQKVKTLAYYIAVFIYLEVVLHLSMYKGATSRIVYPILFAIVSGSILFMLCNLFPRNVSRVIGISVISLLVIYFEVQLVYHCIFGSFMPLSQVTMGAGAITNFFSQLLHALWVNIFKVILLLIPIPVTVVLFAKKIIKTHQIKLLQLPLFMAVTLMFSAVTLLSLHMSNTSVGSAYSILVDPNSSTEACVRNTGLAATTVQEVKSIIAPERVDTNFLYTDLNIINNFGTETNSIDLNFNEIADKSDSVEVKQISKYLAGVSPTSKNEYTGIAKNYNIVTFCAEAFSPLAISPELTPTLYKLSTNGFVFKNFYNCFPNTTTNGEYTMCMGLLPDSSKTKVESSFNVSAYNYLPYVLGNALKKDGYNTYAYHNYFASFYDRHLTHANMGYDFKAISQGLDIKVQNPCSDHDMMLESMDEYLNSDKPFHAYYMTYSGHYQYNWDNDMSKKHRDKVAHLPYSEEVKAYLACNLEVEYALAALMEGLEKAGKADNTIIVLTGDHYPYGLNEEQYNELAGEIVDTDFEKYRNSFICYVPGIKTVTVDDYCSTPDILPTLLNLLGVEYDSRLLVGKDVLSDAPHIAVLFGRNFLTSEFRYNAETGIAEAYDGSNVDMNLVQSYRNYVSNMFTLSTAILESDYYGHVFDKSGQIKEEGSKKIINYSDIKSPYIESAATFMVDNGYMSAEGKKKFGAKRSVKVWEFMDVLYKMQGEPAITTEMEYKPSLAWALEKAILDDPNIWTETVTMGIAADIMYKYFTLVSGEPEINEAEINEICLLNPDVDREMIILLEWCFENSIYAYPVSNTTYTTENTNISRGQMAVYLQRIFFLTK